MSTQCMANARRSQCIRQLFSPLSRLLCTIRKTLREAGLEQATQMGFKQDDLLSGTTAQTEQEKLGPNFLDVIFQSS